jgi:hypothetical protein
LPWIKNAYFSYWFQSNTAEIPSSSVLVMAWKLSYLLGLANVSTSKNLSLIGSFSVLKIGGQILISIDGEM